MEHESSRFENDFEKLSANDEDVVSSSAAVSRGVEDLHGVGGDSHHTFEEVAPPAPVKHEGESVTELGHGGPPPQPSSQPSTCPARTTEKTSECTSCCMMMKNVDPRVIDLLMWRDIKKTGIMFASVFIVLLSLSMFSVLSVIAYFGLVVLAIATSFRLYNAVMCMMNKSTADGGAPFKKCLECDLTIPEETVHRHADIIAQHLSKFAEHLRRLFLVENVVDSIKFGLILWLLTYIGGWFNGMTLLLIASVGLFTLPKVYDTYRVQIDHFAHLGCGKICEVWKKVEEKIPMLAKKKQA